jgi:hypothetical protein
MFFMTISVGETQVCFDGGMLSAIAQALTRYSANDPQFPVNDRSLFTGKTYVVGGAARPNARPTENPRPTENLCLWENGVRLTRLDRVGD